MRRASPIWMLLIAIGVLAICTPAIADEQADPLEILGAGGTVVQPLIHGGPAYGAISISLSAEPLVSPEIATLELLIANGGIHPAVAANLSDLGGERAKLGIAWVPGDIAAIFKVRVSQPIPASRASTASSLAAGEAAELGPTLDLAIAPGLRGFTFLARCDAPLR